MADFEDILISWILDNNITFVNKEGSNPTSDSVSLGIPLMNLREEGCNENLVVVRGWPIACFIIFPSY